jgi:hypothetical protein
MNLKNILLCFSVFVLTACGGGGSGGSGSNSKATLNLQSNNVNFIASLGQFDAISQTIVGEIVNTEDKNYYLVVDADDTNLVNSTQIEIFGSQGFLTVFPSSAENMNPGVYTGSIRVLACTDSSCNRQISGSPKTIAVRYEVLYDPAVADRDHDGIVDNKDPLPLVANRAPVIRPANKYYADEGRTYSLNASSFTTDPDGDSLTYSWRQQQGLGVLDGEFTGNTLSFSVPNNLLQQENVGFWLTARDANGSITQTTVNVSLIPAVEYELSAQKIGTYVDENQQVELQIIADQLSNWQLSSTSSDISYSKSEGVGSQLVNIVIDTDNLSLGSNSIDLILTDARQQVDHKISLEIIKKLDRAVVLKNGIALSKTGRGEKLSAEFTVLSESGDDLAWTASVNQPWLSLSKTTGGAGDVVIVTADVSSLKNNREYTAEITLLGQEGSIPEKIVVGLYLSDVFVDKQVDVTSSAIMVDIASNPTLPYVYGVTGKSKLYVYNLYTAAEVAAPVIGGSLNSVTVSHDGKQIFVFDSLEQRIFVLNPNTFAIEKTFSAATISGAESKGFAYLRPKGLGMLFVGGPNLINATTGNILYEVHKYQATTYVADSQDFALYSFNGGSNVYDIRSIKLETDVILDRVALVDTPAISVSGGYGFPIDFASTKDMSKVWISTGARVLTVSYSLANGFKVISNYEDWPGWQNALESSPDYTSYYLGQDYSDVNNVCAFDVSLNIEQGCINPPSRDVAIRMLKLSSDGIRGIVFSDPEYSQVTQPITFFDALH